MALSIQSMSVLLGDRGSSSLWVKFLHLYWLSTEKFACVTLDRLLLLLLQISVKYGLSVNIQSMSSDS